jgi:phenylpropionate dioxygenase-like ring-hydroxylating dioxygenase large terminal subunit
MMLEGSGGPSGPPPWPTLPGSDYHDADVFSFEQERIFARSWVCVGRAEHLPNTGDYMTSELAGEHPIVIRGADGALRAFANTCRHRGTELLEGAGTVHGAIKCPYHAWTYGFDGQLLGSPNVGVDDGVDRSDVRLWSIPLAEFDGFVFLDLSGSQSPIEDVIASLPDSPLELARYRVGALRSGARRSYDVTANWKIVVENYHECLHCPTVHPELVKIVPLYRRGEVEEDGQTLGNSMGEGLTSFTMTGTSTFPPLPGIDDTDVHTFYGVYLFPNLILNYHSETVNAVTIHPLAPDRTLVLSEFLFASDTVAEPGFDPSEVVEFRDLVARQDWDVCERAQRGVSSRFYAEGMYPRQERWIAAFNQRYLDARGPLPVA